MLMLFGDGFYSEYLANTNFYQHTRSFQPYTTRVSDAEVFGPDFSYRPDPAPAPVQDYFPFIARNKFFSTNCTLLIKMALF
jgi:hypothetical protein